MIEHVDFIARVTYLTPESGGRSNPIPSGYRSQLVFPFSDQQISAQQVFTGRDAAAPGESLEVSIQLAFPGLFRFTLLKGETFELREGPNIIGRGNVSKVVNPELNKKLVIQNRMQGYFPILFEFASAIKIDWETVYDTLTDKFNYHKANWTKRNGAPYRPQASFYDIIIGVQKEDEGAIRIFESIRMLFGSLHQRLDTVEKQLLKGSVFGFLTNMDSKYLNFIGELHFVNYIKITKPETSLVATESLIDEQDPDGPCFDFTFVNRSDESRLKAEIVNVHFNEHQDWDEERIQRHLEQKIVIKLADKRMKERPDVILVPIFWGQPRCLAPVAAYYKGHSPTFPNTFTPFCYLPYGDSGRTLDHIFGTIDAMNFGETPQ